MFSGLTGYDTIGICVSMKVSFEKMAVVKYWLLTVVFRLPLSCKNEQCLHVNLALFIFLFVGRQRKQIISITNLFLLHALMCGIARTSQQCAFVLLEKMFLNLRQCHIQH